MRRDNERRNLMQRQQTSAQLLALIRSPSVLLTVEGAQQLLRLHREACQRILKRLVDAGVLREIQRGVYTPTPLITAMPTP